MKNILIIVDLQNDFCSPIGSLYVKGASNITDKIKNLISQFDEILFTIDWHPYDHCSFKRNGGRWPIHCINYSKGASIPTDIVKAAGNKACFYRKGMISSCEEYGAFSLKHISKETELDIVTGIKRLNANYVVCGIAGDYCVLETTKNLLKLVPKERVSLFLEGIVSIDGGVKLQSFINENKLKIYRDDYK